MIGRRPFLDSDTSTCFKALAGDFPRFFYRIWTNDLGLRSRLVDCISAEKFTTPGFSILSIQPGQNLAPYSDKIPFRHTTRLTRINMCVSRARVFFGPAQVVLSGTSFWSIFVPPCLKVRVRYVGIRQGIQLRTWNFQSVWGTPSRWVPSRWTV